MLRGGLEGSFQQPGLLDGRVREAGRVFSLLWKEEQNTGTWRFLLSYFRRNAQLLLSADEAPSFSSRTPVRLSAQALGGIDVIFSLLHGL